jgi:hypothetical protein
VAVGLLLLLHVEQVVRRPYTARRKEKLDSKKVSEIPFFDLMTEELAEKTLRTIAVCKPFA